MTRILRMNRFYFGLILIIAAISCKEVPNKDLQEVKELETGNKSSPENSSPTSLEIPMLIGTYTRKEGHVAGKAEGIHLVYLDTENGHMRLLNSFAAGDNPSYLAIHPTGKFVYAVNETGGYTNELHGSVTALSVDENYHLSILNTKSSEGIAPCHVSLNNQGTHVLVANYVTGSVTSFPTAMDGRLAKNQNIIRYRGKGKTERQKTAHAHYIAQMKDDWVITADLGTDSLRFHRFDNGQLESTKKALALPAGSGPRHLIQHPVLPVVYVVNELNSSITSFKTNADNEYQTFQTISTLQEGEVEEGQCAALKITPDGRFLYASNRGNINSIAIFEIGEEGRMTLIGHQSSLGNIPRDFEISPDGKFLIVANQDSDNLVSFRINSANGFLSNPVRLQGISTPVCIKFF